LEQPKKPTGGAFGQFSAEKRAEFMKQVAGKPASEVSKLLGAAWKDLSNAAKAPYEKKYQEAKAKFDTDMKAFLAAGGVKKGKKEKKAKGSKKDAKDPDRPRKPAGGAYGCFLDQNRAELAKECKGLPVTAVSKLASERWKTLSAAAKAPYEEAYKKKAAAYAEAMKTYVPPPSAEKDEEEDEAEEEDDDEEEDEDDEEDEEDEEDEKPAKKKSAAAKSPEIDEVQRPVAEPNVGEGHGLRAQHQD